MKLKIRFALILSVLSVVSSAQDSSLKPRMKVIVVDKRIEMKDGVILTGKVMSEDSIRIRIRSLIGDTSISKKDIISIDPIRKSFSASSTSWFMNPDAVYYSVGQSAFTLRKREFYLKQHDAWLSLNGGINDHFSLEGRMSDLNFSQRQWMLSTKYGYSLCRFLSVGGEAIFESSYNQSWSLGNTHYLTGLLLTTLGNTNNNFTFGIGWSERSTPVPTAQHTSTTHQTHRYYSSLPVLTLSGMIRPAKHILISSEFYVLPPDYQYSFEYGFASYARYTDFFTGNIRFIDDRMWGGIGIAVSPHLSSSYYEIGILTFDLGVKFGGRPIRRGLKSLLHDAFS